MDCGKGVSMGGGSAEQLNRLANRAHRAGQPLMHHPRMHRPVVKLALGLASALALACGAADSAAPGASESLQAVLSIERLEHASQEEAPSASALAEFVILPAEADAHETLDAAGLRAQLPGRTGCVESALGDVGARGVQGAEANGRALALAFPEPLELLEAGDVSIDADGVVTRLALNLFPPSGSASGVIYTTPDLSAQPLPAGAPYAIVATGSAVIPPLTIRGEAPSSLRDLTLAGVPLERVTSLLSGQPLDFTWQEGDAGDAVYVEVTDTERSILCGFADGNGSGTVPGALTSKFSPDAMVRLSVHRVREAVESHEPERSEALLLQTLVRFDFETTSLLRVE